MASVRGEWPGVAVLQDGRVPRRPVGHRELSVYSDTVDQIDPVAGKVTPFASLPDRNAERGG